MSVFRHMGGRRGYDHEDEDEGYGGGDDYDYDDGRSTWSGGDGDEMEETVCMRLLKSGRILTYEEENRVLQWIADEPDRILDARLGLFETVVSKRLCAYGEKEVPCVINGREVSGADRVDEMVLSVGMAREAFRLVNPRTGDTMLHVAVSRPVMHFQIVDVIMRAHPQAASVANMRNWTPMLEMMLKTRIAGPDFYSLFAAVAPESFEVSANHARWNGQPLIASAANGYTSCPRIMQRFIDASRPEDFMQRSDYVPCALYNAVGRVKECIASEGRYFHDPHSAASRKIAGRMEIVRMIAKAHPAALECAFFGNTPVKYLLSGDLNGLAGFGYVSEQYYALVCELIEINPRSADGTKDNLMAVHSACALGWLHNNRPTAPRAAESIVATILTNLPHLIEDNNWLPLLLPSLNPTILSEESFAAYGRLAARRRKNATIAWERTRTLARQRYTAYLAAQSASA